MRTIDYQKILSKKYLTYRSIEYFEISAMTNQNVTTVFKQL